jgi:hypothetical protein
MLTATGKDARETDRALTCSFICVVCHQRARGATHPLDTVREMGDLYTLELRRLLEVFLYENTGIEETMPGVLRPLTRTLGTLPRS